MISKFIEMDLPPESEQKSEDVNANISTEGMVIPINSMLRAILHSDMIFIEIDA